jgi:nuclear control of ATPase protein 2
MHVLHSNNQPFSFSLSKPSSIRGLLKKDTGLPYSITASIFPHLCTHPSLVLPPLAPFGTYSLPLRSSPASRNIIASAFRALWHTSSLTAQYILHYATLPLRFTSQEIYAKRLELERIRNDRAEALGELTSKRDELSRTLQTDLNECAAFLQFINQVLVGRHMDTAKIGLPTSLLDALTVTSSKILPMHVSLHQEDLHAYSLLRPSRFIRIWPGLLILPPLTLYAVQRISTSQHALLSLVKDAWETLKGFCRGWLVEPLTDIAKTVRAGGEGSLIVQKESINADLQVFSLPFPISFSGPTPVVPRAYGAVTRQGQAKLQRSST